jgi:hypothetical protein
MLRFTLYALALAGALTARPGFADPATASDRPQAAAAAGEASSPPPPVWSPSPDATAPVGFGWG